MGCLIVAMWQPTRKGVNMNLLVVGEELSYVFLHNHSGIVTAKAK